MACCMSGMQWASAADWNQWRGAQGNGHDSSAPAMVDVLPAEWMKPLWISEEIPAGRAGGWGSPVVAEGKVYLFVHSRELKGDKELPAAKYPWLPPDKRGHLSDEQYKEYEKNRRDEDFMRGTFYNFQETIFCFDLTNGKTLWKNQRPSRYTRFVQSGTPAVVDGKLYILMPGRIARCLKADSGAEVWEKKLPGDFHDEFIMSSFAVADGAAIILAGHLYGLDANSGEVLWQGDPKTTSGTHSSPVVWNSNRGPLVVANVGGGSTVCLEPKTGRELWRVDSEANLSTPVVVGEQLITLGDSRKKGLRCYNISPEKAEHQWTYTGVADKGSSPVVVGQHVYAQGEQRLACVSLESGQAAWSILLDIGRPQYTSLASADGKVFYTCEGILSFAASSEDFRPLMEGKINAAGLLATKDHFRRLLDLDKVEREADGQQKALKLYQQQVGSHGPLECASPALSGGKLIVRLKNGLACYDFTVTKP